MTNEVFYILVALTLASAMISVTFFIAWKTLGYKAFALSWALASVAATFRWGLNLAIPWFPNYLSYWLTVSACAVFLITFGLKGHCQRTNTTWLPENLWPYAAIVYAGSVYLAVVLQHVGLAAAYLPFVAAVSLVLSAAMILKHREKTRPAEWAAVTAILLFALAQFATSGLAIMQGPEGDQAYRELHIHFTFLSLPAGYIGMAIFIVFMIASDLSEEMKELAVHDQLTGLLNRRGFQEQGAAAFSLAKRNGTRLSIILTDVDRFKDINDQFGHAAGDEALCHFADILKRKRRSEDILARIGGEEVALILPGASLERTMKIAEALCKELEASPLDVEGEQLAMTASFGVASISDKDSVMEDIVMRADKALYRSKRAGRNQVDLESSQLLKTADKLVAK
jgi:diguanylate cyclase (GGDEF)-like protein